MTAEVRRTRPDEFRAAARTVSAALMGAPPSDEDWERSRPSWDEMSSFSAWDGHRCLAHAGQFLVDTATPGGGRLATGAVSRVAVLPTARRRGLGTSLVHALLDDARRRDLALMSLRASEAVIYGRFGFGVAGLDAAVELIPARLRPLSPDGARGRCRLLEPAEVAELVPGVYERAALRRPGAITRPPTWWPRLLRRAAAPTTATFVVLHEDEDGTADGYAMYEVRWNDADDPVAGDGDVHELFGATDAVELALWRYLLDVDLVERWRSPNRPVDEPVRFAAHDPRGYRTTAVRDEQWLRLVDLEAALNGRTYRPVDGAVTIAVDDALIAANSGTWEIDAGGARRTDGSPQLRTAIDTLSAAFLGGPSWTTLAAAGRVTVDDPAALATADALFASVPQPFCGTFF